MVLLILGALSITLSSTLPNALQAQEVSEDEPIFRRFQLSRKVRKSWQAVFEIPVALRPQSDDNAEIIKNFGFNYVSSFRPNNRWYLSRSLGISKMEWISSDPNVRRVKVRTFDMTFLVNRVFDGLLVTSFGAGLGLMDGLVEFAEPGGFSERLEPFIPIQFGLAVRLGDTFQLGLKVSHFPFFRQEPVIATTRVLIGVGFSY